MNTAAIYIKTEKETKAKAQKIAKELGLSLSAIVNGFIKQFIKTKTVTFSADRDEIPNKRTRAILKQAEENYRRGNTSPAFDNAEDAIKYLEDRGI